MHILAGFVALMALAAPAKKNDLDIAKAHYLDAAFPEAMPLFEEVIKRGTPDEQQQARAYLGMCHLALGNETQARAQFQNVLQADASYRLPPSTSPKITTLFESIRRQIRFTKLIVPAPPITTTAGPGKLNVRVRFRVEGGLQDITAFLFWRTRGATTYNKRPLDGVSELFADLSVNGPSADLEYYAEVVDSRGASALIASPTRPLLSHVQASSVALQTQTQATAQPVTRKWWFWTVIGVVAVGAGAGVAAYFLTRPEPVNATGGLDLRFNVTP